MKPETAKKIRASFERGIKKSLPVVLLNDKIMKKFRVELTATEPSAYAVCAMQEFDLKTEAGNSIFYGVFDFGGGTSDFDFGLWLESDDEESDYGYELHRLCNKGDEYLGGENLLKLIAHAGGTKESLCPAGGVARLLGGEVSTARKQIGWRGAKSCRREGTRFDLEQRGVKERREAQNRLRGAHRNVEESDRGGHSAI